MYGLSISKCRQRINKELIGVDFDIAVDEKTNFLAVSEFLRVKTKWKKLVIDTW